MILFLDTSQKANCSDHFLTIFYRKIQSLEQVGGKASYEYLFSSNFSQSSYYSIR